MIYMTTDEWIKISKLIEAKDFDKLAQEICVETYDLDMGKQELDEIIQDYKAKKGKRLWKVKYVEEEFYGNEYNHAFVDKEKDIRKLTKIEAEEWLYQVQKERNVSYPKLFYKEDGEWILYKEEK